MKDLNFDLGNRIKQKMKTIPLEKIALTNQEQKNQESKLLPEGACKVKTFERVEAYKNILSYPLAQYLVFPFDAKYFRWIIVRQNINGQEPVYHMYYELFKKRFLSAQKQANNIGCNYLISKKERPKKDEYFVGKLRGNFRNNEFLIYDGGQNPKKKCVRKRKQFGFIKFSDQSIFGQGRQRMQILVPEVQESNQSNQTQPRFYPKQYIPNEQKLNLLLEDLRKSQSKVIKIQEKSTNVQPHPISVESMTYQAKSPPYASYFNNNNDLKEGNVAKINTSFQVKLQGQNKKEVFTMNTRGKSTYQLEIGFPLNLIQAFGIALARIEIQNK